MNNILWKIGCFNIGASVLMRGLSFHAKIIKPENQKPIETATHVQLVNGIGLCLLSFKKKSNLLALSGIFMKLGILLFPGVCYYQRIRGDYRFRRGVPIGGTATVLGWTLAVLL